MNWHLSWLSVELMQIVEYVDLAPMTTYKLGGQARWYANPQTRGELISLIPVEGQVLVLGRGSNVLISDAGFAGLVIRLGAGFVQISVNGTDLTVGGACPLAAVARSAAKADLGGLEWMVGVPGSVGGAVRMNAGCFGSDSAEALVEAETLDLRTGKSHRYTSEELEMAYRSTNVGPDQLVTEATFRAFPSSQADAEQKMREVTRWRKEYQPGGTFNAGSVFKNPHDDAAGRIIDELGLKGRSVGGVSVSRRHANFFVADATASAQDMYDLVRLIQTEVLAASGTQLVPEVQFVGFDE